MATIPIVIRHQGKKYDVEVDTTSNGETLKLQLYSLTGVEPDRQKVLVPGGALKDDADLSKIKFKTGMVVMMQGTASGEAPPALAAPVEKPKFLEEMSEAERANLDGATPAGLQNLGNTCYLNSTLQVLRTMPEMQQELATYKPSSGPSNSGLQSLSQFGLGGIGATTDMIDALRDLYKRMSETQEGFPPLAFLSALRAAYPQFAQKSKTGSGYAQQDAEEAWSQIVHQLRQKLSISDGDSRSAQAFVDKYMAGKLAITQRPPAEAAEQEQPIDSSDSFLKLDCHIEAQTNHLRDGILAGLTEEIEKRSETLDRNAVYTRTSRVSRLPKYLTVHFVRFFWKRDVNKKAKIMKKVTFPEELDVVEFCTDDLRKRLIPVRDKVREIRKDEHDMERARKRQKIAHKQEEDRKHDAATAVEAAPIAKLNKQKEKKEEEPQGGDLDVYKTDAQYEEEREASIKAAKKELYAAIDPELAGDEGSNKSGLYELRGVVTHQGASADSGHYTSFVKKEGRWVDDAKAPGGKRKEEDGKWWWFNDDKVTEVDAERIMSLSGGGESASALILLYRAIDLPTKDEIEA